MWEQLKPLALLQQTKLHFLRLEDYKYYEPEQNQSHLSSVVKYLTRWHVQYHSHACIKCLTAGSVFIFLIHVPSPSSGPKSAPASSLSCGGAVNRPFAFTVPSQLLTTTSFSPFYMFHSPEPTSQSLAFGCSHSLCLPSQIASTAPDGPCSTRWH